MMSLPSPIWCTSASSPLSRARFFSLMISIERRSIVSEIATMRLTSACGNRLRRRLRSRSGKMYESEGILSATGVMVLRTGLVRTKGVTTKQ